MGSNLSQAQPRAKVTEECIFYDNDGALRVGTEPRKRDAELRQVLDAEKSVATEQDAQGQVWFIIEANWVQAWLAFVHQNKRSPAPGPVHNEKLMRQVADQESPTATKGWEIIPGLKCAGKGKKDTGHYRRVGKPVWEAFCELYPHSGPAIWTDAEPCEDTRQWQFDASFMLTLEQTREAGS